MNEKVKKITSVLLTVFLVLTSGIMVLASEKAQITKDNILTSDDIFDSG